MKNIEAAIHEEKWKKARELIRSKLRKNPSDHWLLTRLSLTYYEERDYTRALKVSEKALSLAPNCPLILWDYAGSLQMLGRHKRALKIYQAIIDRGVNSIAYDMCGEGIVWARGLIADSFYRQALSFTDLHQPNSAKKSYLKHLALRGPGCSSIYPLKDIKSKFDKLQKAQPSAAAKPHLRRG